jgi:CobQ-like glutamine amidotransferase family enzyme
LIGKRKPRGKPFEKGNKIGHRFEPGNTGNPGGSSKAQFLTTALLRKLPELADELVEKALERAKKNPHDLQMVWDRAEGPLNRMEITGADGGPVTIRVSYDKAATKNA